MMSRPRIAFLPGDPNGIGPELAAKLLARPANVEAADVSCSPIPRRSRPASASPNVKALLRRSPGERPRDAAHRCELGGAEAITPGDATEAGGRAALTALEAATQAALRGDVGRHRVRAAQQARAAPRRHDARGRAALHAGTLPTSTGSSRSSTSPARCGRRASRRMCRCATSPMRSRVDGRRRSGRDRAPLPDRGGRRDAAHRGRPGSIRMPATAARSAARRSTSSRRRSSECAARGIDAVGPDVRRTRCSSRRSAATSTRS